MRIITFIVLIVFSTDAYTQDNLNSMPLDSLVIFLSQRVDVEATKIFTDSYKNGNIKIKYLGVKYKNDTIDRYWETGLGKRFFNNGNLKGIAKYDINTHILIDTSRIYRNDGSLQLMKIWSLNIDNLVYIKTNTTCKFFPDSYKEIWFGENLEPYIEQSFKYDFISNIYKKHGTFKYYKNGVLFMEKNYNMNSLISKEKYK